MLKSVLIFPPNLSYFTCYCLEKIKISIIDKVLKYSNLLPTNWLKVREVKGFGSRDLLVLLCPYGTTVSVRVTAVKNLPLDRWFVRIGPLRK